MVVWSIEVRSLDINPFSPIGVDEQQVPSLDLFMVWCVLADAPEMRVAMSCYVRVPQLESRYSLKGVSRADVRHWL